MIWQGLNHLHVQYLIKSDDQEAKMCRLVKVPEKGIFSTPDKMSVFFFLFFFFLPTNQNFFQVYFSYFSMKNVAGTHQKHFWKVPTIPWKNMKNILWKSIDIHILIVFILLYENVCCGYSLEAPRRGASNEYQQHMLSWRYKKSVVFLDIHGDWKYGCFPLFQPTDLYQLTQCRSI